MQPRFFNANKHDRWRCTLTTNVVGIRFGSRSTTTGCSPEAVFCS